MNDLISRQAAIDALWKLRRGQQMLDDTQTADKVMKGIFLAEQMIKELPTVDIDLSDYSDRLWRKAYEQGKADAEPRWIPVTERLPEPVAPSQRRGWFLTSNQYGSVTLTCYEFETSPFREGWQTDMTILAWMPLPEPYKRSEDAEID